MTEFQGTTFNFFAAQASVRRQRFAIVLDLVLSKYLVAATDGLATSGQGNAWMPRYELAHIPYLRMSCEIPKRRQAWRYLC